MCDPRSDRFLMLYMKMVHNSISIDGMPAIGAVRHSFSHLLSLSAEDIAGPGEPNLVGPSPVRNTAEYLESHKDIEGR